MQKTSISGWVRGLLLQNQLMWQLIILKTSAYNFGHFVTKENTELINSLSSEKAFDENYRRKQLYKWQEYMNKEAFIVPMTFTHSTISVSKDVKGMTLDVSDSDTLWSNVALTK